MEKSLLFSPQNNFCSADSPVLWLRVDPEMTILRDVKWEQPDFMWQYQLKYERDVVAQEEVRGFPFIN